MSIQDGRLHWRQQMDRKRYFAFTSVRKYDVGVVPRVFRNMEMKALGVL
jgi:hypothetical protein